MLVYVLHVVKSDRRYAETPIRLHREKALSGQPVADVLSNDVKDWLVSDFTETSKPESRPKRKMTFRAVAQGVKFTIS